MVEMHIDEGIEAGPGLKIRWCILGVDFKNESAPPTMVSFHKNHANTKKIKRQI